jgi:hypothetical protein
LEFPMSLLRCDGMMLILGRPSTFCLPLSDFTKRDNASPQRREWKILSLSEEKPWYLTIFLASIGALCYTSRCCANICSWLKSCGAMVCSLNALRSNGVEDRNGVLASLVVYPVRIVVPLRTLVCGTHVHKLVTIGEK